MTTPRYLDLIPESPHMPAAALLDHNQSFNEGGWRVEYDASDQDLHPGQPVALHRARMVALEDPAERTRRILASEPPIGRAAALALLLERWRARQRNQSNARRGGSPSPSGSSMLPPRGHPLFMREGLRFLARIPSREFTILDPDFRLRHALFGDRFLGMRLRALEITNGRTGGTLFALPTAPSRVALPVQMASPSAAPMLGSGYAPPTYSGYPTGGRKRRNPLEPEFYPGGI